MVIQTQPTDHLPRVLRRSFPQFYNIHMVCPEGIQPCNMKNRDIYGRRYKKHCTQDNDASVPFKVGTVGPHTVLPIAISYPIVFSWISSVVWNLFPFKGDLGKARNCRAPNLGCSGAESPGWFDVLTKSLHEMWCMSRHTTVMKLPITSCP